MMRVPRAGTRNSPRLRRAGAQIDIRRGIWYTDMSDFTPDRREGTPVEEREARIRLKAKTVSLIAGDGEDDAGEIEYSTCARLTFDGKVISLSYEESADLGFENSVTTLLFEAARPEMISMVRTGTDTASLIFDPATFRQTCAVNTTGMHIEFVIYTRRAVNTVTLDAPGVIDLDYVIEIHGVKTERNLFRLEVTPGEVKS